MVEEEDDALADLLGVLAQGQSQRYTLNGNTSTKVSLCRVLGFFSEADYHALLVSKQLASYRPSQQIIRQTRGCNVGGQVAQVH